MNKSGFKVSLNCQTLCRAGFDNELAVITCILNSLRREFDKDEVLGLTVSGLNSETDQHVNWINNLTLHPGDKITVEVIGDNFDNPKIIHEKKSEEFILQQKLKYFKELREELKDYIND